MIPNFDLFGKEISFYMLSAIIGVLLCLFFSRHLAKYNRVDDIHLLYMILFAFGGAAIGGHLFFALTQPASTVQFFATLQTVSSLSDLIVRVQAVFGGSVFYGGLLAALLVCWLYMCKHQLPKGDYADIGAIVIPLFHTCGRIGCFLSGCCFGVEWEHGIVYQYSPIAYANGVPRFPVQLVEAAGNLLIFLLLWWLFTKRKLKHRLLSVYLFAYPVCRFVLEFFRGDQYRGFLWGLSTSQWVSLLLIVGNALFLLHRHTIKKRR